MGSLSRFLSSEFYHGCGLSWQHLTMAEWQLHYFCFHGKHTNWTFFSLIFLHITPLTTWQLACHNAKVANIAEEEWKYLFYHKMILSIYSLPWSGVHDKAPGEINMQFISEVTLISFCSYCKKSCKKSSKIWAHTSGFHPGLPSYLTKQQNSLNA